MLRSGYASTDGIPNGEKLHMTDKNKLEYMTGFGNDC